MKKTLCVTLSILVLAWAGSPAFARPTIRFGDTFTEERKRNTEQFLAEFIPILESVVGTKGATDKTVTLHFGRDDFPSSWDPNRNNLYIPGDASGVPYYWFLVNELSQLWLPRDGDSRLSNPFLYRLGEYIPQSLAKLIPLLMTQRGYRYFNDLRDFPSYGFFVNTIAAEPGGEFRKALLGLNPHTVFQLENNYAMNGFACDVGGALYLTLYRLDNDFYKKLFDLWLQNNWSTPDELVRDIAASCKAQYILPGKTVLQWVLEDPIFQRRSVAKELGIDVVLMNEDPDNVYPRLRATTLAQKGAFFAVTGFSDKKAYLNPPGTSPYETRWDSDFFGASSVVTLTDRKTGQVLRSFMGVKVLTDLDDLGGKTVVLPNLPAGEYSLTASMDIYGETLQDVLDFTVRVPAPSPSPEIDNPTPPPSESEKGSSGGGCNAGFLALGLLAFFPLSLRQRG